MQYMKRTVACGTVISLLLLGSTVIRAQVTFEPLQPLTMTAERGPVTLRRTIAASSMDIASYTNRSSTRRSSRTRRASRSRACSRSRTSPRRRLHPPRARSCSSTTVAPAHRLRRCTSAVWVRSASRRSMPTHSRIRRTRSSTIHCVRSMRPTSCSSIRRTLATAGRIRPLRIRNSIRSMAIRSL